MRRTRKRDEERSEQNATRPVENPQALDSTSAGKRRRPKHFRLSKPLLPDCPSEPGIFRLLGHSSDSIASQELGPELQVQHRPLRSLTNSWTKLLLQQFNLDGVLLQFVPLQIRPGFGRHPGIFHRHSAHRRIEKDARIGPQEAEAGSSFIPEWRIVGLGTRTPSVPPGMQHPRSKRGGTHISKSVAVNVSSATTVPERARPQIVRAYMEHMERSLGD